MKCKVCGRKCKPIPISNKPEVSEWYCPLCHKSYKMTLEELDALIIQEKQRKKENEK